MTDKPIITQPTLHGTFWTARASVDGTTREFHNRYGSWQTDRRPRADEWPEGIARREALPHIARALETKVQKLERKAARLFEPAPEPMSGQLGMSGDFDG